MKNITPNIESVKHYLDHVFKTNPKLSPDQHIHEVMDKFNTNFVISLLESIIQDPEYLKQMAEKSYKHALGFTKIVLAEGGFDNQYKLRLHLWWPERKNFQQDIYLEHKHIHKWDFTSKMLSGKFENHIFAARMPSKLEIECFNKLHSKIIDLPQVEQERIHVSLDAFENSLLEGFNQHYHLVNPNLKSKLYELSVLKEKLGMNNEEIINAIKVHRRYNPIASNIKDESTQEQCSCKGPYHLENKGIDSVDFVTIDNVYSGKTYFQKNFQVHRLASDLNTMIATLVLTDPPVANEPYLLIRKKTDNKEFLAPELTAQELAVELKCFSSLLRRQKYSEEFFQLKFVDLYRKYRSSVHEKNFISDFIIPKLNEIYEMKQKNNCWQELCDEWTNFMLIKLEAEPKFENLQQIKRDIKHEKFPLYLYSRLPLEPKVDDFLKSIEETKNITAFSKKVIV